MLRTGIWPRLFFRGTAVFFLLSLLTGYAAAATIELRPSGMNLPLTPHAAWLEDPSGKLSIYDIQSGAAQFSRSGAGVNFGITSSAYWFKFEVHNPSDKAVAWIFEGDEAVTDFVDIYLIGPGEEVLHKRSGDRIPRAEKELDPRKPVFQFIAAARAAQTVFVRYRMEPVGELNASAHLYSPDEYGISSRNESLFRGIFYGAMGVMFFAALFIYLSARMTAYLYYVAYLFSMILFWLGMDGYGITYLWKDSPNLNFYMPPLMVGISLIFATLFMQRFLAPHGSSRAYIRFSNVLYVPAGLLILASIFQQATAAVYLGYLGALSVFVYLYSGGRAWYHGYRPARFYTISWAMFVAGTLVFALKDIGLLPYNAITVWSAQVGGVLEIMLLSLALGDHISHIQKKVEATQRSLIFAMAKLTENRDPETGMHLERMALYCRVLSRKLRRKPEFEKVIDEKFIEDLYEASPLHDIGKVGVPDAILQKNGKLTDEEYEVMKIHTLLGAKTLEKVELSHPGNRFVKMGIDIAASHHEKWDGTGYPYRLAGERIPLAGRIVAVGDVYDALTSKRCYKPPMPHEKAAEIVRAETGKHFDPKVVDAFIEAEVEFKRIKEEFTGHD